MKRLVSVLMLIGVLVLASGGSLSGHDRSLPPGPAGGAPSGDDHPWGGDQISIGGTDINRTTINGSSPQLGTVRCLFVRMVCWLLVDSVELSTTNQTTVVKSRGPVEDGSRPGVNRGSTTSR